MTKLEMLQFLEAAAKRYRLGCAESVARNKHMNRTGGVCNTDQNTIDAILVGFINHRGKR
jgi:hypothetical protein